MVFSKSIIVEFLLSAICAVFAQNDNSTIGTSTSMNHVEIQPRWPPPPMMGMPGYGGYGPHAFQQYATGAPALKMSNNSLNSLDSQPAPPPPPPTQPQPQFQQLQSQPQSESQPQPQPQPQQQPRWPPVMAPGFGHQQGGFNGGFGGRPSGGRFPLGGGLFGALIRMSRNDTNETLPDKSTCFQTFRVSDLCPGDFNKTRLRWFYNSTAHACQPFIGCRPETEGNNFQTIRACGFVCDVNATQQWAAATASSAMTLFPQQQAVPAQQNVRQGGMVRLWPPAGLAGTGLMSIMYRPNHQQSQLRQAPQHPMMMPQHNLFRHAWPHQPAALNWQLTSAIESGQAGWIQPPQQMAWLQQAQQQQAVGSGSSPDVQPPWVQQPAWVQQQQGGSGAQPVENQAQPPWVQSQPQWVQQAQQAQQVVDTNNIGAQPPWVYQPQPNSWHHPNAGTTGAQTAGGEKPSENSARYVV